MSPLEENQNSRSRSQRKHDLVEHCIFLSMSSSCICLSAYKLQSGCRVTSKTDLRSSKIQVNKALWKKPNWYPKFQTSRQTSVWGMTLLALEKWIYNIIQHRLYYNIQHVIQFFISKIFQKIICFFFLVLSTYLLSNWSSSQVRFLLQKITLFWKFVPQKHTLSFPELNEEKHSTSTFQSF